MLLFIFVKFVILLNFHITDSVIAMLGARDIIIRNHRAVLASRWYIDSARHWPTWMRIEPWLYVPWSLVL